MKHPFSSIETSETHILVQLKRIEARVLQAESEGAEARSLRFIPKVAKTILEACLERRHDHRVVISGFYKLGQDQHHCKEALRKNNTSI